MRTSASDGFATGQAELGKARRHSSHLVGVALLFSIFVNLLMLTGPLFMLQVYDRVLSSRSEETLVALFILIAGLFVMMALLDFARGRLMTRVGARFQAFLDMRVFEATMKSSDQMQHQQKSLNPISDLEAVKVFYGSPAFMALLDLPWTPLFIGLIFVFHAYLGWLAVAGAGVLISLTFLNQITTNRKNRAGHDSSECAQRIASETQLGREIILSQGMLDVMGKRWSDKKTHGQAQLLSASDWTGGFSSTIKAGRLFLQSAMLAAGAFLVLQGALTGGAMIASSIILGRALAPIEVLLGQWSSVQRARAAWASLSHFLGAAPGRGHRTKLPTPKAELLVSNLTVIPFGACKPVIRRVSFRLEPGQALGVIGHSGSGKSTLAKALLGLLSPAIGDVRLGGATLDQYDLHDLGQHVGYLPQSVSLFSGTIAENIARMSLEPDAVAVVAAARLANAHGLITKLPEGYDTLVSAGDTHLSGGQQQRIALARALYADPVLLILDEPNSALDSAGSAALNASIRTLKAAGKAIVIMTHRPAAIGECDQLLVLENGIATAFGPRDQVLKANLANAEEVQRTVRAVPSFR